ncbi:helix-turn-helix transcriptional regulator [Streptomyces sp. NPDC001685]
MIRNERQLAISRRKLAELREAANQASGKDREVWLSLAREILCEIDEFDAIRRGELSTFEINSLDDLPESLIKARVSRKLTQSELASRLGVSEQMVQKDEAGGYETARLDRLADVCDALEFEFTGRLQPAGARVFVSSASSVTASPQVQSVPVAQPIPCTLMSSSPTMLVAHSNSIILKELQ